MALKTKIGKAEYEALNDALKTEYIPDGDGYKLDADYEDVTGLKAKRDELLEKLNKFKEFEGLDAADVKAKLAALAEKEDEDLKKKGAYEELERKLRENFEAEKQKLLDKINSIVGASAEKDLQLKLVAAGVKENLAEDLAISLRAKSIKHVEQDGKIIWKTLDDTETVDLDKYIPGLKENGKADYFKSDLGAGSGASGSSGSNGNGAAKTMPVDQFHALSGPDQAAFIKSGGKPVD